VVVVVADSGFVSGRMARRFDAPYHPGAGEGVQRVIDGLDRQTAQSRTGTDRNGLGIEVLALPQRCEDR